MQQTILILNSVRTFRRTAATTDSSAERALCLSVAKSLLKLSAKSRSKPV